MGHPEVTSPEPIAFGTFGSVAPTLSGFSSPGVSPQACTHPCQILQSALLGMQCADYRLVIPRIATGHRHCTEGLLCDACSGSSSGHVWHWPLLHHAWQGVQALWVSSEGRDSAAQICTAVAQDAALDAIMGITLFKVYI